MGKLPRRNSPRKQHHVYNRGIDKKDIYLTIPNKYYFKQCCRESLELADVSIYGYAIMDNHMHFLLEGDLPEIGTFMQYLQGRFAYTYNLHNEREGRVFQNVYKSKPIYDDRYFWGLIRYIHMNPVKAGRCRLPGDYLFSSYHEYAHPHQESSPLISSAAHALYQKHFKSPQDFQDFHMKSDTILYDDIREEMDSRMKDLENQAFETLCNFYGAASWRDLSYHTHKLPDIVHLLSGTYQFTPAHISSLLGISPYHVRNILKSPAPSSAVQT